MTQIRKTPALRKAILVALYGAASLPTFSLLCVDAAFAQTSPANTAEPAKKKEEAAVLDTVTVVGSRLF